MVTDTLHALAQQITQSFDFDFYHAFGFYDNPKISRSIRRFELFDNDEADGVSAPIYQLWREPGDIWYFLFDYGDNWMFVVTLKKFNFPVSGQTYPRVLSVNGVAPEQYPEY